MAQGSKGAAGHTTANSNAPPGSNGVITGPGVAQMNRKKLKRRQKLAAKQAEEFQNAMRQRDAATARNGQQPYTQPKPAATGHQPQPPPQAYSEAGYRGPDAYDDAQDYTEDEDGDYGDYDPRVPTSLENGHLRGGYDAEGSSRKKSKKKKKNKSGGQDTYNGHHVPSHAATSALRHAHRSHHQDRIWNTSTQEERERIKDFWLSLAEDERKSLVKIEKDAVLKKMKEQQKHSCSCTVCGRKRTAIEEELEVLYDAYYEELEGYVVRNPEEFFRDDGYAHRLPPASQGHLDFPFHRGSHTHSSHTDGSSANISRPPHHPSPGHIAEIPDDEDEEDELGEDEEYSEEEDYDEEYSDDDPEGFSRAAANELFNFGNSLQVKGKQPSICDSIHKTFLKAEPGGILTVADDLLKNDGKKFIEMMEQLAERRMQREEDAQYAAAAHPSYQGNYGHNHGAAPDEEEFDEDEEEYDSQEDDYDEEEDDMVRFDQMSASGRNTNCQQDIMTEDQRMQEGRRMFQIFAARLFEQRVLTAYRERVAQERQKKLLEELEDEKTNDAQREAKKARDAEKKKQKKQAQKAKQAEEKARKDAQKAEEERRLKEAEQKRQEELKKKREEQRKKKEAERKAQEEERQRKEAERLKRLQEERERQQEAERKAREQKAAEKKAREDAKRKEREAREREARERKAQADKEKKEREEKAKAEREANERARKEAQLAQVAQQAAQGVKRAGAPTAVPIPPGLQKQSSNLSSPHVPIATPAAIPKAPTPVRPRQSSQQGSKGSSPKTPQVGAGATKSASPGLASQSTTIQPKTILQKPHNLPLSAAPPMSPSHPMPPPTGMMPGPQGFGMGPMNGFGMPGMGQRPPMGQMPQFPLGNAGNQFPGRPFVPPGMSGPPPGFGIPGMAPFARGFPDAPPGLHQPPPGMGMNPAGQAFGAPRPENVPQPSGTPHSRQQSGSFDPPVATPQPQAIQRPAPIQRPSSVKPEQGENKLGKEVDEMANHLGSASLLDDNDEPLDTRRPPQAPGLARGPSNLSNAFGPSPIFPPPPDGQPRMDPFGIGTPGNGWGTPALPFGQAPPTWGGSPTNTWAPQNPLGFPGRGPYLPPHKQNRLNICNACRHLTQTKQTDADGYVEAGAILRHLESNGQGISIGELFELCETFGEEQDGGGQFEIRNRPGQDMADETALIRFDPNSPSRPNPLGFGWGAPGGVGEIGSPSVGNAQPGMPFGRPSIGARGP